MDRNGIKWSFSPKLEKKIGHGLIDRVDLPIPSPTLPPRTLPTRSLQSPSPLPKLDFSVCLPLTSIARERDLGHSSYITFD